MVEKVSLFMQSHGKSTDDVASIFSEEFLKEDVVSKPCRLAIFFPLSPQPSMVQLMQLSGRLLL
jgi:hypothetical protein